MGKKGKAKKYKESLRSKQLLVYELRMEVRGQEEVVAVGKGNGIERRYGSQKKSEDKTRHSTSHYKITIIP